MVAYDRRGFGKSDPGDGYDYDALADDLDNVLSDLDLSDVTLVGFSMGGGEVARYVVPARPDALHSVVFAAAVPPYLLKTDDNPDGPLTEDAAGEMRRRPGAGPRRVLRRLHHAVLLAPATSSRSARSSARRRSRLCRQSDQEAALGCMAAFGTTDFRDDLTKVTVPTLVIHGDADGIVPFEGSGKRTHEAIEGSELVVVEGAPHGCNVSHAEQFNAALLEFLEK